MHPSPPAPPEHRTATDDTRLPKVSQDWDRETPDDGAAAREARGKLTGLAMLMVAIWMVATIVAAFASPDAYGRLTDLGATFVFPTLTAVTGYFFGNRASKQ